MITFTKKTEPRPDKNDGTRIEQPGKTVQEKPGKADAKATRGVTAQADEDSRLV
ncbi:MAG: hypothetical protein RIB97_13575 [Nitratireductor sp.]